MLFHYALVDDLIGREEFERKVEERIESAGGLLDPPTAAMLVVQELGRSHRRIGEITRDASICMFFGRLLACEPPREFNHSDGRPGQVARLTLGDESGVIHVLLWDERAGAVEELECGESVEVIGRPSRSGPLEIHALNLRPAVCHVACDRRMAPPPEEGMNAVLLSLEPPREIARRDGSVATLREGLIGTGDGTYRFTCWSPALVEGLEVPCTLRLSGVRAREGPFGREYHLDERGSAVPSDSGVTVPRASLSSLEENGVCSLEGEILSLDLPRTFARDGNGSWVRRLVLRADGGDIGIVLWGEVALRPLARGDRVMIYHLRARRGRTGGFELHSIRGTAFLHASLPSREVVVEGLVIPGSAGARLEGDESYLVEGELPVGVRVRVEGQARGGRLVPLRHRVVVPDRDRLEARLDALTSSLSPSVAGTL